MIRLQCPHCRVIVKIDEGDFARHPVVRCAYCKKNVPVQFSVVQEGSQPAPAKRRRRRSSSEPPIPLIAGVLVGLLLLAGIGVGCYYWFKRTPSDSQIASMKNEKIEDFSLNDLHAREETLMEALAQTLESVRTRQDVDRVAPRLKDIDEAINQVRAAINAAEFRLPENEREKSRRAYLPRMMKWITRLSITERRLKADPELATLYARVIAAGKTRQEDQDFKKPENTPRRPYRTVQEQIAIDSPLLQQCLQKLTAIISRFETITQPHQLPELIRAVEAYNQEIEEIRAQTHDNDLRFFVATRSNRMHYNELFGQLGERWHTVCARFVAHHEFREALTRNADEIQKLKLDNKVFGVFAVDIPHPDRFDEFRPAATKPDSAEDFFKNPSRGEVINIPKNMKPADLIQLMHRMKSHEKEEIFKSLKRQPVKDKDRDDVLALLCYFMEDTDTHNKEEVFKQFKKWASTQAQKEKVGLHAEELLKSRGDRKDAINWFGENKVISSAKEVARILRDRDEEERNDAAMALIAMGPEVEPVVLPYLENLEARTRHLSIEVLARIGTRECMPGLRKLINDAQVGLAAKQALILVDKRYPAPK